MDEIDADWKPVIRTERSDPISRFTVLAFHGTHGSVDTRVAIGYRYRIINMSIIEHMLVARVRLEGGIDRAAEVKSPVECPRLYGYVMYRKLGSSLNLAYDVSQ